MVGGAVDEHHRDAPVLLVEVARRVLGHLAGLGVAVARRRLHGDVEDAVDRRPGRARAPASSPGALPAPERSSDSGVADTMRRVGSP